MSKEAETLTAYKEELKGKLEGMKLRREVNAMEAVLGLAGQQQNLIESGGNVSGTYTSDMIRKEIGFDDDNYGPYSMAHDRARGSYEPFISNEQDLARIRSIGRFFAMSDCSGVGIRDALVNYVVGEGFNYEMKACRDDTPPALVEKCTKLMDLFLLANDWHGCREEKPLEELVADGEVFLILRQHEDGIPRVRIRTGEHFTEPVDITSLEDWSGYGDLDWSYGIGTPWGEPEAPAAYFAQWYGDINAWEVLDASVVEHIKLNVPEDVKRGISDFYAAAKELERAGKGINAVAVGATIQATIAMIEKGGDGATATEIESALLGPNIYTSTATGGATGAYNVKIEDHLEGRVMRTSGKDVMYGPMGTPRGSQLADTFGAVLRRVAVRWGMTEFMVSGDASNNNMASSVVAESPMNRGMKRRQRKLSGPYVNLIWKAIGVMAEGGALDEFDLPIEMIKKLVCIEANGDEPAERDAQMDETIRKMRHEAGILSLESWAEQVDIDLDEEIKRGAKPAPAPAMGQPGQPGGFGQPPNPPPEGEANPPGQPGQDSERPKPEGDQLMQSVVEEALEHVTTVAEAKRVVQVAMGSYDDLEHSGPSAHPSGSAQKVHGNRGGSGADGGEGGDSVKKKSSPLPNFLRMRRTTSTWIDPTL